MKSTEPAEPRVYSGLVRPLVLVLAAGLCALVASGCGGGSSETAAPPAFVERYGWAWPSIQDPQRDRARLLGADYQPHFILVDTNAGIVDTWEGGGDASVWEAMAAQLP